jgi:proteasome beta subunit
MPELHKEIYKGTTTIGLVFSDGVVLATERRATMGNLVASKTAKKVYRYYPYYVQLLVGGIDKTGPSVYSVDAMGGASREEDMVATGSGSPFAYGVLEDRYRKEMTEAEAIDLAIRALKSAMRRDVGSGEDINVVVITREKYEEFKEEGIQKAALSATN